MVQSDLAARLAVHVVAETLKSPVVEIAILVSATSCLLASVNTFAGLLTPTFSAGNVLLAGVSVAWAAPVPESGTVCGLFAALSVIVRLPVSGPSWVGVKVTLIVQLFPAASVLPQVVLFLAKSPLVAMLLMSSVTVATFLTVTIFAGLVMPTTTSPHASEVGDRETTGPLLVTVSINVVDPAELPDMPEMVRAAVPIVAVAFAVRVNVLVVVAGLGTNAAVTPLGKLEAAKVTLPLKPFTGATVMVLEPLLP
jgi:hypothetical protein